MATQNTTSTYTYIVGTTEGKYRSLTKAFVREKIPGAEFVIFAMSPLTGIFFQCVAHYFVDNSLDFHNLHL